MPRKKKEPKATSKKKTKKENDLPQPSQQLEIPDEFPIDIPEDQRPMTEEEKLELLHMAERELAKQSLYNIRYFRDKLARETVDPREIVKFIELFMEMLSLSMNAFTEDQVNELLVYVEDVLGYLKVDNNEFKEGQASKKVPENKD